MLKDHIGSATFDFTIRKKHHIRDDLWVPLLKNKYGNTVGGIILPLEQHRKGFIFIFPNIKNKKEFIIRLIKDVLPDYTPRLFPGSNQFSWVNWHDYELPKVKLLKQEIDQVREKAEAEINSLQASIEEVKLENLFLNELITQTGDKLVEAVIKTLNVLGFQDVKDVDQELTKNGKQGQNREDIQIIKGGEPKIICEVKGINNYPSDEDALTVQKYVVLRMREWNRTDLMSLSGMVEIPRL